MGNLVENYKANKILPRVFKFKYYNKFKDIIDNVLCTATLDYDDRYKITWDDGSKKTFYDVKSVQDYVNMGIWIMQ